VIEVFAEQDDTPVRGNAMATDEPDLDREYEDEILARLDRGDVWAWAHIQVKATCPDCGAEGLDSLVCCSYESEAAFRADVYYADMVDAAKEECRALCTCRKPVGVDSGAKVLS
jgi:hypothetical protein